MRARVFLLLPIAFAPALAAQVTDTVPERPRAPVAPSTAPARDDGRGARWRTSYYPYIGGAPNDGPMLSARLRYWQPAPYEAPNTYNAAFDAAAGIAPRGSRYVSASFKAPQLWDGWRLSVIGMAIRQARYGYYGLGNETTYDKDAVTDDSPYLYRMRRTRYRASVEVTRRIRGPLQLALLTEIEQARFTSLPGPSVFAFEEPSGELRQTDVAGRVALIYDTRDNEFNTHQGLLLEAGSQVGSGGDGYTRQYVILRGYLTIREGTVVAARLAGSGMGGTPSLDARFTLPGWENPVPVIGGEYSNRGLDTGRLTGKGTLFGNLEVRHDLLPFGDLGAVTLLAFVDAGRVFERESFRLTTDGMKVSGGGGVALRILRSTIFTFNLAGGPEGANISVGSGWMF